MNGMHVNVCRSKSFFDSEVEIRKKNNLGTVILNSLQFEGVYMD